TSGKKSGTGLGTYSAKLMAETLGGTISMFTSENDGTTITVKLKQAEIDNISILSSTDTSNNQNVKSDMEQLPSLKILIVDDDEYNRIILARYLNYPKLNIEVAGNGKYAVEMFQERNFDIIFLDMEMPVMNGIDAACLIRKLESEKSIKGKKTILVALSGHDDAETCEKCLKSGFDAYLSKPVSNKKLRETLLRFFSNKLDIIDVEVDSDLQDLIPSFLSDKKGELETIFELLNKNDYDRIQKVGHKLKGGFNMYGFTRLGAISSAIEEAAKQKDYDKIKNNIEFLTACFQNIRVKYVNMD
ncbi:MAG: response regulator, partial [Desulfobacterales bacterium]|nr:response regulator [Desulfobacterales bacterium]